MIPMIDEFCIELTFYRFRNEIENVSLFVSKIVPSVDSSSILYSRLEKPHSSLWIDDVYLNDLSCFLHGMYHSFLSNIDRERTKRESFLFDYRQKVHPDFEKCFCWQELLFLLYTTTHWFRRVALFNRQTTIISRTRRKTASYPFNVEYSLDDQLARYILHFRWTEINFDYFVFVFMFNLYFGFYWKSAWCCYFRILCYLGICRCADENLLCHSLCRCLDWKKEDQLTIVFRLSDWTDFVSISTV